VAKGRAEKGELQKRLHGRALNSAVLGIRIRRTGMFLGHQDPLVKDTVPDLPFSHKSVERTEIMLAK
jgi:hypothetical protein